MEEIKKELAISICSKNTGKLPTKTVSCVVCEEDCQYSGFGNTSLKKFTEGEEINIDDRYRVKVVCTDCMHHFFITQLKCLTDMSEMQNNRSLLEEVEKIINPQKNA